MNILIIRTLKREHLRSASTSNAAAIGGGANNTAAYMTDEALLKRTASISGGAENKKNLRVYKRYAFITLILNCN